MVIIIIFNNIKFLNNLNHRFTLFFFKKINLLDLLNFIEVHNGTICLLFSDNLFKYINNVLLIFFSSLLDLALQRQVNNFFL